MIPKISYFSGGQLRWSYLWDSPNHAGGFLLALLPLIWAGWASLGKRRRIRFLFSGAEILLLWLIVKTYSRGALLGTTVAAAVWLGLRTRSWRQAFRWALPRAALIVILIAACGATTRISPSFLQQDASVGNRWDLYRAGLMMFADNPWGYGVGESGFEYALWYQPVDSEIRYLGLVNTFLEVAVENGIIVFTALIFLILLPPATAITWSQWDAGGRSDSEALAGAASSALGFGSAATFSTMSDNFSLWIPLSIDLCLMGFILRRFPAIARSAIGFSGLAAIFITTLAFVAGYVVASQNRLLIEHRGETTVVLSRSNPDFQQPHGDILVAPDTSVLGGLYGREIRDLAVRFPGFRFTVVDPRLSIGLGPADLAPDTIVVLTGARCKEMSCAGGKVILICPAEPPEPSEASAVTRVVLGSWDELGVNAQWKRWAAEKLVPIMLIEGVGQDVSTRLIPIFGDIIEG